MQRDFLDFLPIWGIFVLTVGLCLLSVEVGFWLGKRWRRRHPEQEGGDIATMLGATLGLWALLLAFLVNIATNRFDDRRSLVVQEANAIGTAYLRAGYLPEPYASESRKIMRQYAESRTNLNEEEGFLQAKNAAPGYQAQLWNLAQDMAIKSLPNPLYSIYITSLSDVFDLHTSRITALTTSRVPYTIYISIYIIGMLGMLILGFHTGMSGKRNWIIALALILVYSTIITLVIDLDRPWGGALTVSQQPMIDLINSFSSFK
jgi:hypothetical protein